VYTVFKSPPSVIGLAADVVGEIPGCATILYVVMGRPPSLRGASQLTVRDPSPLCTATTFVGGSGTVVPAKIWLLAALGLESPWAFVATIVNVYATVSVRPVTVMGLVSPVPVPGDPAGEEVTVYPVIGDPPLDIGGLKYTRA
jgi:hypothetical protein